jgi:hypothetical protein
LVISMAAEAASEIPARASAVALSRSALTTIPVLREPRSMSASVSVRQNLRTIPRTAPLRCPSPYHQVAKRHRRLWKNFAASRRGGCTGLRVRTQPALVRTATMRTNPRATGADAGAGYSWQPEKIGSPGTMDSQSQRPHHLSSPSSTFGQCAGAGGSGGEPPHGYPMCARRSGGSSRPVSSNDRCN